jgi:hypothetical protein
MIFKIQDLLFSQTITSYNGIYREVLIYAHKKKKKKIEKNMQTIFKKKNHNDYFNYKTFVIKPEALKSLYRSPGYKKKQLVLCKNYVLQW